MSRPYHVFVQKPSPSPWKTKVTDPSPELMTVMLSPVYDEDLGEPLGQIDGWMPKDELFAWVRQRYQLLGLSSVPEFVLVPPVGWYRDLDYREN